jgi:YHS domain-containing protein
MRDIIKCKMCKTTLSQEACKLAGYKTLVDGNEYAFCCKHCAESYETRENV